MGLVLALTGCAGPLVVDSPAPEPADAARCADLVEAAPESVAGADRREVDSSGVALAWGDPAMVLRCGLAEPARLRPGSRCDTVEGVDWLSRRAEGGYRFDTIGRATTVRLFVPDEYEPAGDVLVDLARAIRGAIPAVEPCR